MPTSVVIEYPKEEANGRNPYRVRCWAIAANVPVYGVRHMTRVIGTIHVDPVPTTGEEHAHLQLFACRGGEEVIFAIAVIPLAGTGIDTFREGVGEFRRRVAIGTGNHAEVFGKGPSFAWYHVLPDVICRRLANLVSCICLSGPVVSKDGRMPVQTLVLLDVARELIDRRGHELVECYIGIGEDVGAVVGVDVIAEAGLADDWISTDMAGGKKVHLDRGCIDDLTKREAADDERESSSCRNEAGREQKSHRLVCLMILKRDWYGGLIRRW